FRPPDRGARELNGRCFARPCAKSRSRGSLPPVERNTPTTPFHSTGIIPGGPNQGYRTLKAAGGLVHKTWRLLQDSEARNKEGARGRSGNREFCMSWAVPTPKGTPTKRLLAVGL